MKRIEGLEGLRAYMAIWVFFSHVLTMAALPVFKSHGVGMLLVNGNLPVNVFVILSGFVIGYLLISKDKPYRNFIIARGFRLFPAYLVSLFLSLIFFDLSMESLKSIPWEHSKLDSRLQIFNDTSDNYLSHLISHLLLLHGLIPDTILSNSSYAFIGQAWSLSLEWQFYLVAPLIITLFFKHKVSAIKLTISILLIMSIVVLSKYLMPQPSFLPNKLPLFILGIASSFLYIQFIAGRISHKTFIASIGGISIISSSDIFIAVGVMIWFFSLVLITSESLMKGSVFFLKPLRWLLINKAVNWLGNRSYSFYCLHMVSIYFCVYVLIDILGIKNHAVYAVTLIISSFILTLLLSVLSYKFIELPFIKFGKVIADSRKNSRCHIDDQKL